MPGDDATRSADPDDPALPAAAGVGRVALCVADLDRLVAFYEDVVGLATHHREDGRAVLGAGDEALLLLEERPDLPPRAADETGLFHVALRVPTRAALGAALERIEARWEVTGASDHLVSEALYLDDPAGNGLEIYLDRPRGEWPVDEDGGLGMETLPLDLGPVRDAGSGADRLPDGTTVGHVHLEVSDIEATRAFYVEGLGMGVRQRQGASAVFLAAGDYHHHVGANVWNGRTEPGDGLGLDWFEVRVPDEAVLAAVRRRFEDRDVDLSGIDDGFAVRDPDDVEVRVVEC